MIDYEGKGRLSGIMYLTLVKNLKSSPTATQISPSSSGSLDFTRAEIWAQRLEINGLKKNFFSEELRQFFRG